jgi:DNA-binding GntR family transcriptional regulator
LSNQASSQITKKNSIPARKKTYEYLKTNILSGAFDPGRRLTEEYLAEELGVSRTPVREALHKLELEGLIQPLETRGFIIPRDSKEEMEELFDIRAILEGYTLRLVSESISEETLKQLNGFIENAEDALKRQKIDEIFQWNTEFHDALHNLVGHKRRLYDMIVNIRRYVLRYRKDTLHYLEGAQRALEGHRKVMMALRLRDPDLCERVMRDHIREAKEDALKAMFEQQ